MFKMWMFWILAAGLILSSCSPASLPTTIPASDSPEPALARETPAYLPTESPPRGAEMEFTTDFSKHIVPFDEILSGGPPKDGIPSIDAPAFLSTREADEWLADREPVVFVQVGDDARAYPIQILMWHEIVNDAVGGEPLLVSFCPLCNTAIVFKRTVNGAVFDFGTTGRLRFSNLIMYDRQTETWWQQATGEAIVGELAGAQLEFVPAAIIAWGDFKSAYPNGKVLSRETGFLRDYGRNPYVGYDDVDNPPFLYDGPRTPDQLPPMARVLTVHLNGEAVAYPYEILERVGVVNDVVGGEETLVVWQAGAGSALDAGQVSAGREVGASASYSRRVEDQILTFVMEGTSIKDVETGSSWNIFGLAVDGALKGTQLTPIVSINHFWFSWAAFMPQTRIYQP